MATIETVSLFDEPEYEERVDGRERVKRLPRGSKRATSKEVDWSDPLEVKLAMMPPEDNRPFPRQQKCLGCGNEFTQKRHDHLHCKESCRWKKCIKENRPSAQRARQRSKDWYARNADRHKANVACRKVALEVASFILRTLSTGTVSECIGESATSAHYSSSSRLGRRRTTSRIITLGSTGVDQSQCACE
jgi:hypothetical protein